MNEDLLESINNVHKEITEMRTEQNEFRINIAKHITSVSRDTEWMRERIEDINTKFDNCGFCKNPEESSSIKKSIQELKDEQNKVKYTAIGIATILSIIVTGTMWFIQNKDHIIP